jgi:hypothetical protein
MSPAAQSIAARTSRRVASPRRVVTEARPSMTRPSTTSPRSMIMISAASTLNSFAM